MFAAVESSDGSYIWSRIFGEFGAGAFLFILWRGGSFRALPWKVITPTAALASIALAGAIDTQHAIAPVLVSPLVMVLIYGLAIQSDSLSWFLSRRPLVFAGEASYALYMTHAFTQRFIWERLPVADYVHQSAPIRAITVLTWFVLLAFIAVSLHIIVERPARDGMRWLVDRRRRAAERPRAAAPDLPHPQIGIP